MPVPLKFGKIFMKDASGNLVQIIPESASKSSIYQGATTTASGIAGLVPSAAINQKDKFLKGDGTWAEMNSVIVTETEPTISDNGNVFFYIENDELEEEPESQDDPAG